MPRTLTHPGGLDLDSRGHCGDLVALAHDHRQSRRARMS